VLYTYSDKRHCHSVEFPHCKEDELVPTFAELGKVPQTLEAKSESFIKNHLEL
jgi:hypothetical protein